MDMGQMNKEKPNSDDYDGRRMLNDINKILAKDRTRDLLECMIERRLYQNEWKAHPEDKNRRVYSKVWSSGNYLNMLKKRQG